MRAGVWRFPGGVARRAAFASHASFADVLGQVSRRLAGLSKATESDFLAVGKKLQDIHAHFASETESLGNLLGEIGGERARQLGHAFEEATDWAREAEQAKDCGERLAGLAIVARAVYTPVADLQSSLRALRVMNIMTRVESARLGDQAAGFESLARRADEMADGIQRKSAEILAAAGELGSLLGGAAQTLGDMSRSQQAGLVRLSGECSAGIAALRGAHERASQMEDSARAACRGVAGGIANLVVALQSHDSTRQRLEHVQAALNDLTASQGGDACMAVELQAAQLHEAREAFLTDFGQIVAGLDQLAAQATAAARQAREFGAPGGATEIAAGAVEQRFAEARVRVAAWIASRRTVAEAAGKVERKCADMAGFVCEIEAAGAQMLWVALNAEIQAARLSASGRVMEAVAQGIRRVAQTACTGAAGAGHALRGVEGKAAELTAALGAGSGSVSLGAGEVVGRIDGIMAQLAAQTDARGRLLESLAQSGERMAAEITALRRSIAADRVMKETVAECLDMLASARPRSTRRVEEARSERWLRKAETGYAMRAERDVHAAFSAAAVSRLPAPSNETSGEGGALAGSEFGANVELF